MNKVVLMGRLTADPELRTTQSGISVCKFNIAVNRCFKDKSTGKTKADFISCQAWRQTAEFVTKYFSKGGMICLEGSLQTGNYKDKNYPDVTHYTTDVIVENVEFTGSKSESNNVGTAPSQPASNHSAQASDMATIDNGVLDDLGDFEEILSDGEPPF